MSVKTVPRWEKLNNSWEIAGGAAQKVWELKIPEGSYFGDPSILLSFLSLGAQVGSHGEYLKSSLTCPTPREVGIGE
jgi:hypothetical protein